MLAVRRSLQCSDEEAADILERRLTDGFDSAAIADMFQTDGVDDVIDSSDHKLVTDYCRGARDTTEEAKELQNTIRTMRQASAKAKAKARGKKNTERRPQVKLPGDRAISQVEASSLLPPDCKIRRDEHQKRWQIVMGSENEAGGRWSKSRSWCIGGDERAAVEFCIRLGSGIACLPALPVLSFELGRTRRSCRLPVQGPATGDRSDAMGWRCGASVQQHRFLARCVALLAR